MRPSSPSPVLLCRALDLLCALPLAQALETSRPLPVRTMAGLPPWVLGVTLLRGNPVPVVDLATLLGGRVSAVGRFVAVRTGDRAVALAVESVVGVLSIETGTQTPLPALLSTARSELVDSFGVLDAELLVVLRSMHVVPAEVWGAFDRAAAVA